MCEGADVVANIATEAGCQDDACGQHGLALQFGTHKTAAICVVKSPGSRDVLRKLLCGKVEAAAGSVAVLQENREATNLPVVDCYKHLEVTHNAQGSIKQELRGLS